MKTEKHMWWGLVGILLLVLTIGVACALNVLSYKKTAAEIFTNSQRFVAVGAAERMDFAIMLGKPIERFYGAEDILRSVMEHSVHIKNVWVIDAARGLLYCVPSVTQEETDQYTVSEGERYLAAGNGYYVEQAFSGGNVICMLLDGAEVDTMTGRYAEGLLRYAGILAGIASVIVLFAVCILRFGKRTVIAVIVASQFAFGMIIIFSCHTAYLESMRGTVRIVGNVIARDIEKLSQAGITREEFYGFDEYLQGIADRVPEIVSIREGDVPVGEYVEIGEGLRLYGQINGEIVRDMLVAYGVDTVVLVAITLFLIMEVLFYIDKNMAAAGQSPKNGEISLPATRLFFFVLYLGVNMGASFVTLASYRLCLRQGFFSGLMIGLPITAEMIAGLAAILMSGGLSSKLGYRRTLILCISLCVTGLALTGIAQDIFAFVAARAVIGFGFSLATMTGRMIAAAHRDPGSRSLVLANLTGGTLVGYCCGAVIGGLLADRFDYVTVFNISALIPFICLPLLSRCRLPNVENNADISPRAILSLIRDKGVAAYLFLLVVPINAAGMFMTYSVPLFGSQHGLTTTLISGLIIANSLLTAYLSPYSTRFISGKLDLARSAVFYGIFTAAALAVFSALPFVWTLFTVVIALGVADSFGLVVLLDGINTYKESQNAGSTNTMIAATLTGKTGQVVAPSLLAVGGGSPVVLTLITAVGVVIFGLLHARKKQT